MLWEHDDIAFGDLAGQTLIPAPSLVGVVDRLARQKLVARRRSEADRRNVFVHATVKGRALQREVQPKVNAAYAELKSSMNNEEWDRLITSLERLAAQKSGPSGKRRVASQ